MSCDLFTRESNSAHGVQFQLSLKLKDFSRSRAATFTVKVAISRKRCNIETLLQQIT